jgi:hypothetical protein
MKNLKILNSKPIQEDFWGNGAIYHGYAGMPDDAGRVYSEELSVLESERAAKMKLKIARTYYTWWAWDSKTNTWDWDNEILTPFYKWLQRMKDADITVALNTGWWCPGDILSNCHAGPAPFTVDGDWNSSVQKYADWVSETVHQLIEVRGFTNVKILVLFTEPQHLSGKAMTEDMTPYQCWYDCSKAAHNALVRDGRRDLVKLMGPNEGSTVTSDMLHWVADNTEDFLDIYSSHSYQFTAETPYEYIKKGSSIISAGIAGGRAFKAVKLDANTEYTAEIQLFTEKNVDSHPESRIIFGVFKDVGNNDVYYQGLPLGGVTDNSLIYIKPEEISTKAKSYSFKFKTVDAVNGNLGMFYDLRTMASAKIACMSIKDSNGNEIIENSNFGKGLKDWTTLYCGGATDAYADWQEWCNTGMQYVPNGKAFCYDEYNVIYNKDFSRDNHGAEICSTALAFMNKGVNTSLLWTLFDQQWPNNHTYNADCFVDGDHRYGIMPNLLRSRVPYKNYYAFSLISKYFESGSCVFKGEGEHRLVVTMAETKNGDITIAVVNRKDEDDEFIVNFEKALGGVSFNRHLFDPATCTPNEAADIIGTDKVLENISNTLSDSIPAFGVAVYTTIKD